MKGLGHVHQSIRHHVYFRKVGVQALFECQTALFSFLDVQPCDKLASPRLVTPEITRDSRDTRGRETTSVERCLLYNLFRFRDIFHCHLTEYRVPTSPWTIKHGLGFHLSQQASCCRYHAATEDQVGQRGGPFTEAVTPPYQLTASYSTGIHRQHCASTTLTIASTPGPPDRLRSGHGLHSPTDGLAIVLAARYRTTLVLRTNAIDDTTDSGGSVSWLQGAPVGKLYCGVKFRAA